MTEAILSLNAGSSSLKYALYDTAGLRLIRKEAIDGSDHLKTLQALLDQLQRDKIKLVMVGHRVVHGKDHEGPAPITPALMKELKGLVPLAPLHQPANLKLIEALTKTQPGLPQIACFDTSFHHTQRREATMFALPRHLYDEGIRRYGFHGLSYEYIASVLPAAAGKKAAGRVIVAHLGSGASMCAMKNFKSQATSMGFSALDGLMMGTRCGAVDPGVLLYLLREKKLTVDEVEDMLYRQSGLKGVSGVSADMRDVLMSPAKEADDAVRLYCYLAAQHVASLACAIGGIDLLVFTGGVGANQPEIRERICMQLDWMGVAIDAVKNAGNHGALQQDGGEIGILAIPTDEELIIARHCQEFFGGQVHLATVRQIRKV